MKINGNTSKTGGNERSPMWASFRDRFIKGRACAVCGGKTKVEAHHIIPFSLDPTKELDEKNLIALCEGKKNFSCHLIVGHGGDYRDYNPYCRKSANFMHWLFTCRQKAH
jgi:hypothetical protein